MNVMIIKESSTWGNYSNVKNTNKYIRLMKKSKILQCYPFLDHHKIYAYKPKNQKGPTKEDQTFIVSYPYNYDSYKNDDEFINQLNEIDLAFHKEKCVFRDRDAYKIIIYENSLPLDILLQHTYD